MDMMTVILTGGLSRRMGQDKGLLPFGGETLLAHMIARWQGVFDGVGISVDRAGRFATEGIPEYADLHPGQGPFAGLEAALTLSGAEAVFLTAVDLPFGDPELARRLETLRGSAAACFLRRQSGRPEPLFGIYTRNCLPALTGCMERGSCGGRDFFPLIDLREVSEEEVAGFDLDHILFNVNRPEDFHAATASLHR